MQSQRADGRGHWPAGKRRHPPAPDVVRIIRHMRLFGLPWREIAELVGVDQRTIRNWVQGIDVPEPRHVKRIRQLERST